MVSAIRFYETGSSRVLKFEKIDIGMPARGEALIEHTAIGLNFIDIYVRTGLYPNSGFPSGIGFEGAGVVRAIGTGVTNIKPGDRVAYGHSALGAYATERLMPATQLVKIPKDISDQVAAAIMLKGMTAQYLIRQTYRAKTGQTVLFHAAAGGVGLIACQWLKSLGVQVIGTVGSEEKMKLAKKHGCKWVINLRRENFVERVRSITRGAGVPVVYDGIGKTTFMDSLDCLEPRGLMVSFGNASGPPPEISPLVLTSKGSLYLTRPTLATFINTRESLGASTKELFRAVKCGDIKVQINQAYALNDAAKAQRDLERRRTTGSSVLIP